MSGVEIRKSKIGNLGRFSRIVTEAGSVTLPNKINPREISNQLKGGRWITLNTFIPLAVAGSNVNFYNMLPKPA